MKDSFDVVIVGGAVIGSSVAYFLSVNPDFDGTVLIVERDPSYARSATALSSGSIRNQFSNPVNVRIGQFGTEFLRDFSEIMAVGSEQPCLDFCEGGYLFLATTDNQVQILRQSHAMQRALGVDVVLWTADELQEAFPHLRTKDLQLASYGRSGEGWFSNTGLMNGFRTKAGELGASYQVGDVVDISRAGDRVVGVTLASGRTIPCGWVVNASGSRASLTAAMAGLSVPVEPRKRTTFVFDCQQSPQGSARVNEGRLPLMIDSSGVFCRPEGKYFMAGTTPDEDPAADWNDFEPRHEEFERIWSQLADRSRHFEAIKLMRMWAGHYDFNYFDHNAIVGPHDVVRNFLFANGFTGHGLQQSPAVGRGVSELITYGKYRTLDLSAVGYARIAENKPFPETAII